MTTERTNLVRVVGCGRRMYRDDQVGLLVIDALRQMGPFDPAIEIVEATGSELTERIGDCDKLILVDAAAPDVTHPAGSWQVIDYRREPHRLRSWRRSETHSLGVAGSLELADALGTLPRIVRIYAIAIADARPGCDVTPAAAAAIAHVAKAIAVELRSREATRYTREERCHA